MKYISNTTEFHIEGPSAVTLGKFDGLHRGHQILLNKILQLQKNGYTGIVFEIAPDDCPVLSLPWEKRQYLSSFGINYMIHCPYDPVILTMEPEIFISKVLHDSLHAQYIVVGSDFRFGYQRKGDVKLLQSLQKKYNYQLIVIPKERYKDREISSTYIREMLSQGDMELVRELMGYFYPVEGKIIRGHQLGHELGIPTINLVPDSRKILPPSGVYYSDVLIKDENTKSDKDGFSCHGITNIGYKPTVDGNFLGIETYLYGVDSNLYGLNAKISLRCFHRQEMKFTSVEELKAQMQRDILSGKEYFGVK